MAKLVVVGAYIHIGWRVFYKKGYAIKYTAGSPNPEPRTRGNALVEIQKAVVNNYILSVDRRKLVLRLQKLDIVNAFVSDRLHCIGLESTSNLQNNG